MTKPLILSLFVAIAFSTPLTAHAQELPLFNGSDLNGWKEKSFEGNTSYKIVGDGVLNASCDAQASSLYLKKKIDLSKTPVLNWSWKVGGDVTLKNNERSKAGDDYAARLYAVVDTGTIIPKILTLNYVFARDEAVGENWPNPFYSKAIMITLNNKSDYGAWKSASRNIRDDLKMHFGKDITSIDGIAIMTDCDNSAGKASAHYKRIFMSAK